MFSQGVLEGLAMILSNTVDLSHRVVKLVVQDYPHSPESTRSTKQQQLQPAGVNTRAALKSRKEAESE